MPGITWGFTVAICTLAFLGKFGGCTLAARYSGFHWRESGVIGSLMICKGLVELAFRSHLSELSFGSLVELIVLNVGLSAGILSQVTVSRDISFNVSSYSTILESVFYVCAGSTSPNVY